MANDSDQPNTEHYLKVVDCQYACPAHTDVPEYIRLIFQNKFTEAYLVNQKSNVFPGILGRVCDRPCEPACRRGRFEQEEPVAICRLKRVCSDLKDDVDPYFPKINSHSDKKIAVIGAGPASLTVVNDLLPLGYQIDIFEKEEKPGGMMRYGVPAFRLPESVLDEETFRIINRGAKFYSGKEIKSLSKEILSNYDCAFIGTGAPLGKDLIIPGREEAAEGILIGLTFLKKVAFEHIKELKGEVLIIGGGNTAMDCARTSLRLGAKKVTVCAPEEYEKMLASDWEISDTRHEGVIFKNNILPEKYIVEGNRLTKLQFRDLISCYDKNNRFNPEYKGEERTSLPADHIILAIGQKSAYDFIDSESNISFSEDLSPIIDKKTLQSSNEKVFFGGDSAFGPTNIIWSVQHGHMASESMHLFLQNKSPLKDRNEITHLLDSKKMGVHQWNFDNEITYDHRQKVPELPLTERFDGISHEVELGYEIENAKKEAQRCLNCDIQTVFTAENCIECDACLDICPTDCLDISSSKAKDPKNPSVIFESNPLKGTGQLMIKDENFCVHCGLCAEKCPTSAWDMEKFTLIK